METMLSLDRATFRQLAVLMAMQGLLAIGAFNCQVEEKECAASAIRFADALLEAMTATETREG